MKNQITLLMCLFTGMAFSQGPPITADKPIMLGGNSFTVRTLTEVRNTQRGTFVYVPLMMNYLPTANTYVALDLPYISYDFEADGGRSSLADIKVTGKYQFLRKDGTGRTFRMAVKTVQTLPTGAEIDMMELSSGLYQGYYSVVAGYESLKYGISSELGYNTVPGGTLDEVRYKLGFGLPLLKPQYPNKQVNLYFEYTNSWLPERDWYQLLYAQGIQYARKSVTFDLAVQVPLVNDVTEGRKLQYSLFLGTRFTF